MDTVQPSELDMPPLEDRPSLAERVATLEARVAVLEAAAQSSDNQVKDLAERLLKEEIPYSKWSIAKDKREIEA